MLITAAIYTDSLCSQARKARNSVSIRKRLWGVTVTQSTLQTSFLETVIKVLSALLLLSSSVLALYLVASFAFHDVFRHFYDPLRDALAVFTITASGFFLRQIGLLGVRKQAELDVQRQEIRIGFLGTDRKFRIQYRIQHKDIVSAFLVRGRNRHSPARLYLRTAPGKRQFAVISGHQNEVEIILGMIVEMRTQHRKTPARTRTTDRLFQVTFPHSVF